jgi:hypothetical protein
MSLTSRVKKFGLVKCVTDAGGSIHPLLLPKEIDPAAKIELPGAIAKQLAERLGQPDSADKVEEYYHQLEWGNLPANKVDRSVVKALSEILEEDEQELWEAGTGGVDQWSKKVRRSQSGGLPKRAFARLVGENKPLTVDDSQFDPPAKSDWDDTDRLFLGG